MTGETLLESLDRHFTAGCPVLSASQMREHEATGVCGQCSSRAQAAVALDAAEARRVEAVSAALSEARARGE